MDEGLDEGLEDFGLVEKAAFGLVERGTQGADPCVDFRLDKLWAPGIDLALDERFRLPALDDIGLEPTLVEIGPVMVRLLPFFVMGMGEDCLLGTILAGVNP